MKRGHREYPLVAFLLVVMFVVNFVLFLINKQLSTLYVPFLFFAQFDLVPVFVV